ncbi:ABC transporter substrate-binding protein, partial [Candidatus Saccharibacteria bacterium]|nr:ABC transporter substrate-binding protein [Candidatus Saccharibacteria bacterium]NIV04443.1 ABC transporter substrate-binding protein [Calditrichia bacterium]NIV73013.1 ABC transporter substrate-binding protein [Calditrichia bacterium]NIW00275.1 ABC transporter substrate-binding protein [Candidatus Saccharibacteria bacterium]NIW80631.1 ABC transporter substrate-binding protein [Calditrichia bacterium]
DPDKARLLLDEAGFPDPDGDGPQARFGLVYKCSDKLQSRQKAQVVQQDLKDVGIDVSIRSYEWGTFFDDIRNGRFDLYSLSYVGIYEPAI